MCKTSFCLLILFVVSFVPGSNLMCAKKSDFVSFIIIISSPQIGETSLTWLLLQDLFHIEPQLRSVFVSTDWQNELEEMLLLLSGGSLHGSAYLPLLVNWNFIHIYAAWHFTSIWLMVSHFCDWLCTLTSQWNVYKLMEDLLPG